MTDFAPLLQPDRGQSAHAITLLTVDGFDGWLSRQPAATRALAAAQRFTAKPNSHILVPQDDGIAVVAGVADPAAPWALAKLAETLPEGSYRLDGAEVGANALGWLLGQYRFTRYRKAEDAGPRVLLTRDVAHRDEMLRIAAATALVRDLVNTGAGDLGPAELEAQAEALAQAHGATVTVTAGETLARDYPMIHAVGQAATRDRAPRLIELAWGNPAHPRIAIVGKGVCFDTGGLDIKPSAGMLLMKKDMGGAANVLGLASIIMAAKINVRLRVLIPAVENSIAGNAFRPGDVLRSRKGITVEIGNTDAEGRLILADALTLADEEQPALLIDMATLTGAARVALGPDLPPFYTNDETLAADLAAASVAVEDPLWRMPLWRPYDAKLSSKIADINNVTSDGFAGSITAALFLKRFVEKTSGWAHFDIFAWNPADRPYGLTGGEAQGIRALEQVIAKRFG